MTTESNKIENNIKDLHGVNYINGRQGTFTVISKCGAGHFVIGNSTATNVYDVFRNCNKKTLWSIAFLPEGDSTHQFTVYAKKNMKTISIMDMELMREIEVGDINDDLSNTNLYDQEQYNSVDAKTWASKVFIQN